MSRRYYQDSRSPSAVFVPMPVDRGVLGEKKVEALQRQIERLENDQMKRKELIEKLSKNQDKNQRKHQEKLLEKYNKKNILTDEIERIYGDDKGRNFVKSPASPRVLETVMAKRTKEFSMKQQEKELETKYLLKERERLQMARDRIREQRRALLSPAGKGENKNELDVISFLKGMGLYRRYESPLLTPLPWERPRYKNGKRVRYVACPLFKNW